MARFVRNWFSGELEEKPSECENGRKVIARIEHPMGEQRGRAQTAYTAARPWKCKSLAVHADQSVEFNEAAKAAGTGAFYTKTGELVCESREARNRELARRGYGDGDAGFGDRPPGG